MKKKIIILLSVVIILLIGIVVWFNIPLDLMDLDEAGDWNNFIINSDDTIRKDPFFYSVTKGNIDYSYIEGIVE